VEFQSHPQTSVGTGSPLLTVQENIKPSGKQKQNKGQKVREAIRYFLTAGRK